MAREEAVLALIQRGLKAADALPCRRAFVGTRKGRMAICGLTAMIAARDKEFADCLPGAYSGAVAKQASRRMPNTGTRDGFIQGYDGMPFQCVEGECAPGYERAYRVWYSIGQWVAKQLFDEPPKGWDHV